MINNDIPQVHKAGHVHEVRLNRIFGISHHKKSLSDISGEFCVNFPSLPNVWHESGIISRNSSSNSLVSVRTDSQISNITGFEDEIIELKRLSEQHGAEVDDAVSQKISDLNGELKIKKIELDALSDLNRDYQSNLIKIQCQESVIISLKDQIREQYCTIEEHKQRAQIYENSIKLLNNEINVAKKSELWFKDEFHQAQENKLSLQNRLIKLENENLDLKIICNKLKNNIQLLQINSTYIEEKSKREKELLINKLTDYNEEISHQIEYDTIKLELSQLQNRFVEQNLFIDNLTAENNRFTRLLHESNNKVTDLNLKLEQISRIEETRMQQLDTVLEQNSKLSEVNSKLEMEKSEINNSIKKLKFDFDLIQTHFLNQKRDLESKGEELSELQGKYEILAQKPEYDSKSTNTENMPMNNNLLMIKNESDDVKKLKILIRVLENEYKVKIKRFETNIRLLLKKIKENFRIRKHLESKYEMCSEKNKSLAAEKNEIIMNLMKVKSLNLNNHSSSDIVNFVPNLKNNIKLLIDEFNKLYDSNSNYLINLNNQNSIINSLNCKLVSLTERQEKMQLEFSQKEQKLVYELNSTKNQLNKITESLRTSQQLGVALTHSKQELHQEIKQLNCEITRLLDDKICLKNLNSEFKENLNVLMENKQRSAVRNVGTRIDYKKINDLLSKSNGSNNRKPLEPLKTCVELLKSDMEKLNLIIKHNNSVRYELSLMDELKHAEKFN